MTQWWENPIADQAGTPAKSRAATYYRHSAQDRQENSIPIQQEQVREWAKDHDIEIVREYADGQRLASDGDSLTVGQGNLDEGPHTCYQGTSPNGQHMVESMDILGLGCSAIDELLYVDAYPAPDGKVQVRHRERQCGGLTATALVAGARMGCRCAYAGTLGNDELSQFVIEQLCQEGIDTTYVRRRDDARPIRSVIIVDENRHTRAILYDLAGVFGADPLWPHEEVIRAAKVLFVDHYGVAGMIRAAEVARRAGIPVVADLECGNLPQFAKLLGLIDHLIISRNFAETITGQRDPAAAARSLWAPGRRAAAVTCGGEGCWYLSDEAPGEAVHQPAFAVTAVDTTGCGDVFHGAYAAALVEGLSIPAAVRFATAAAALKAARRGGQAGAPTRPAVEALLAAY